MISARHAVPRDDVFLGVLRADQIDMALYPQEFDARLADLLQRRRDDLTEQEEKRRVAARDILRNGSYKPTGRGKPASEYLLRSAARPDYSFPRINAPVDICNYLSLLHVLPISLWDLDLSESDHFVFRLGKEGESYVFNAGGQEIDVTDLLVGCRVREDANPTGDPIVNPVKDSLATKTTADTRRVAACVYAPATAVTADELETICREFVELLDECGDDAETSFAVLHPATSSEF